MLVRVIVNLKSGVPDDAAAGKLAELRGLGFGQVEDVRVGKWFLLDLRTEDPVTANSLAEELCQKLLANGVFEDYQIQVPKASSLSADQVLAGINEFVKPHGLTAEYLGDIKSVGVQGDDRTYTRVIVLVGPFPGWDVLGKLGTEIPNRFPVNRITYESAVAGKPSPFGGDHG